MTEQHRIADGVSATIRADGAELCALQDAAGHDLLWGGGPVWPGQSPVLFPIVGQVIGDRIRVDGRDHSSGRHGFARRRRFEWIERAPSRCSLELRDDAATRASYPFAFRLALTYAIQDGTLRVDYALENTGDRVMPASLGVHPAFRWPLRDGEPGDYRLEFAEDEQGPIHRLSDGLLDPAGRPSPIQGRDLALDPALFVDDAIVMLEPRSRSLRYVGPGGGLEIGWEGFPQLGLWQKPDGAFICIEPWHGYASPVGWDGEFADKPGVMAVAPGETRRFGWQVRPIA